MQKILQNTTQSIRRDIKAIQTW